MADLPDYYTQTAISEAEAAGFAGGLDANKSATPVSRDIYLATDTHILYVCFADGTWTGFNAAMLTMGILTLYANMLGGGFQIKNIAHPSDAMDATTKSYVLARIALEATARGIAIDAEATARANADALRLLLTGGTMSGDIAMGTKKLTGLGAPTAQNDSLRYGQAEIRNAEIAAGAAIAYAKLNLTGAIKKGDIEAAAGIEYSKLALAASIVMADFAAAIKNAANGIVVLDASADVPDAQIPNLAAGKITSGRFPVARLPAVTDEKILKGTGTDLEEVDVYTDAAAKAAAVLAGAITNGETKAPTHDAVFDVKATAETATTPGEVATLISDHAGDDDPHGDRAYADGIVKAVATGSYVGDNAASRQITVGFKCSLVIIRAAYGNGQAIIFPNCSQGHGLETPYHAVLDTALHASDGFTVTNTDYAMFNNQNLNENGLTLYYWAISE